LVFTAKTEEICEGSGGDQATERSEEFFRIKGQEACFELLFFSYTVIYLSFC